MNEVSKEQAKEIEKNWKAFLKHHGKCKVMPNGTLRHECGEGDETHYVTEREVDNVSLSSMADVILEEFGFEGLNGDNVMKITLEAGEPVKVEHR